MDFHGKTRSTYRSELAFLSAMTLMFGLCCLFFGYLILPVAAGFYAALLYVEKKDSRVLSYIIPLIPLAVNVFVNGFCSLEALSYVIIGVAIYIAFDRKINKATAVFFTTVILIIMMMISLALLAFDELGTFEFSALSDFYIDLYESMKTKFVALLTSFTSVDDNGFVFHNFNASVAVDIYNSFVFSLVPLSVIFALFIVGLSMKLLMLRVKKYNEEDARLGSWKFVTSPFLAYSYIVLFAFSTLSSQGVVGLSISFVASILMAVYFYIGICTIFGFIASKKGSTFAILSIAAVLIIFNSFLTELISFVGVFINNSLYKTQNSSNAEI